MMKKNCVLKVQRHLGWLVILMLFTSSVHADEIHLKSGKIITTPSVQERGGVVVYEKKGGMVSISKELVREIIYSQPSQASPSIPKTSKPVANYPFDGNADDVLSPENKGLVHGARLVADRRGQLKSAYRFDGIDNFIQVDTPALPKPPFSVSFWFNTSTLGADGQYLLSYRGLSGSFSGLYCKLIGKKETTHSRTSWPRSGIQCGIHAAEQNFSALVTRESLTANEWHHVLLAWDGIPELTHVSLYLDGGLASLRIGMQVPQFSDNVNILRIGAPSNSVSTALFMGILDELRFYDRVLSAAEIQQLSQFTPKKVEFWDPDEE